MLLLKMEVKPRWFRGFGGFSGADFSDIFEDFFGDFGGGRSSGRRNSSNRGSDLRYDLTISLEEAYSGNKIYNSQLQQNVILAKERVQNLEQAQIDVLIAVEVEEYDLIKVFLLYNRRVHNVQGTVRK